MFLTKRHLESREELLEDAEAYLIDALTAEARGDYADSMQMFIQALKLERLAFRP